MQIVNPLPAALHHYQEALLDVLAACGVKDVAVWDVGVEAGESSHATRAWHYCKVLRESQSSDVHSLVLWPTFGYLELVCEAVLAVSTSVIFHDAQPMRKQFGMAPWQAKLVRRLSYSDRREIITHSRVASDALEGYGWNRPRLLPLPVMARHQPLHRGSARDLKRCVVLGQFKDTRSLGILDEVARELPEFSLRIVGRGWPEIPGWEVDSAFVSEERFEEEILESDVVLIPYEHFFQSGVLAQVCEHGRPAVTVDHEQTRALYGEGWCGVTGSWDARSVAAAIRRASDFDPDSLKVAFDENRSRVVAAWAEYVEVLHESLEGWRKA